MFKAHQNSSRRGAVSFSCDGGVLGSKNLPSAAEPTASKIRAEALMHLLALILSVALSAPVDTPSLQQHPSRVDAGGFGHREGEPPVYTQTFTEADARKAFTFSDPRVWSVKAAPKGGWLEHRPGQKYKTPQRSPHNIALLADWTFEDFILEAEFLQTGREYGHRDQCVFFGFQDPTRFYYVHLSTKADANAHNVFVVDRKPRRSFAKKTTKGIAWGRDAWHKVRIERSVSKGTIRVFFDDMKTPIMLADSKTHGRGWIGFGSFDDEGRVRNIKVWSKSAKRERTKAFSTDAPTKK